MESDAGQTTAGGGQARLRRAAAGDGRGARRRPTRSRGSSPTTCGRCRPTRRCSSSSDRRRVQRGRCPDRTPPPVYFSTQVSFAPPPRDELTIMLPPGPPGSARPAAPRRAAARPRRDCSTNARRSTARGSSLPSANVGWVDSCTRSWATQPAGSARIASASSASSCGVGVRADHDALPAVAVDRLEHQLVEPVQHLGAALRVDARVGRHVVQQRRPRPGSRRSSAARRRRPACRRPRRCPAR